MRAISFMVFKQHCAHSDRDAMYDNDPHKCRHSGNINYKNKVMWGEKYCYRPCSEKNCPVMQGCREVG